MNENNSVVTIKTYQYDSLVGTETKYDILTSSMLESAQLAFDRKSLRFDDEMICTLLKAMLGYTYDSKLEELQREYKESLCAAEPDSTTIKV